MKFIQRTISCAVLLVITVVTPINARIQYQDRSTILHLSNTRTDTHIPPRRNIFADIFFEKPNNRTFTVQQTKAQALDLSAKTYLELEQLGNIHPLKFLTDIPKDLYEDLSKQNWQDILASTLNYVRYELYQSNSHNLYDNEYELICNEYRIMNLYGLFTMENGRAALKLLPHYDQNIILMQQNIESGKLTPETLQEISKRAYKLEHEFIGLFSTKEAFDIAGYIKEEAHAARERLFTKWVNEQKPSIHKFFSPEKVAAFVKDCAQLHAEMEYYLKQAPQRMRSLQHLKLLKLIKNIETHLPAMSDTNSRIAAQRYSQTPQEKVVVKDIANYNVEFSPITYPDQLVGNRVQHLLFKNVFYVKEQARALERQVSKISNATNNKVAQQTLKEIYNYSLLAKSATQAGNVTVALENLSICADLYAYTQALVNGTYSYEEVFSSTVMNRILDQTTRAAHGSRDLDWDPHLDHLFKCAPGCTLPRLHYQQRIICKDYTKHAYLRPYIEALSKGDATISVQSYQLTPQARQLLEQHTISTALFTRCIGNKYEQMRHKFCVDLLNETAKLHHSYPNNSTLSHASKALVALAHNEQCAALQGNIEQALTLSSIGHAMYDLAVSVTDVTISSSSALGKVLLSNESLRKDLEHLAWQVARLPYHAAKGLIDGTVTIPRSLYYVAMNYKEIAENIFKITYNLNRFDTTETWHARSLDENIANMKDAVVQLEPLSKALVHHIDHLHECLTTMSTGQLLDAAAYEAGRFRGELLITDGIFRALSGTMKLTKAGTTKLVSIGTKMSAEASTALTSTWAKATTALESTIAKTELEVLGMIKHEQKLAQAAGTPLKNHHLHFNEALVEKVGADKVAAKAAEIGARIEKGAAESLKHTTIPDPVYRTVKETGEKCRIVRPLSDLKIIEWAPKKYEEIRNWIDDIQKIAKNTGWQESKIKQIKDHLFFNEHKLESGVMRFDADHEIAAAWDRLYEGDFIKNDIKLLEHEYYESIIEKAQNLSYRDAHNATEKAGNLWDYPNLINE